MVLQCFEKCGHEKRIDLKCPVRVFPRFGYEGYSREVINLVRPEQPCPSDDILLPDEFCFLEGDLRPDRGKIRHIVTSLQEAKNSISIGNK
jgi:hypothetical protein